MDVLPPGTSYDSSSIPCTDSSGTVTCGLGTLADDEARTFTITVLIAPDLVHNNGSPLSITNTATADSDRNDRDPTNDQKSESTLVKAKADLEIVSFAPADPPPELTVGQPATVTMHKVITNNGPSAPMDTRVARTASATPNATVSPTSTSHVENALALGEQRSVDEEFEIACTNGGAATFTFANDISPERPDDTDPIPANNHATSSFTVECIVPVAINIHPGSFKNPINLKSKGVIPLAVLTTHAGEYGLPLAFDATKIQPLTTRFGPKAVITGGRWSARVAQSRPHRGRDRALRREDEGRRPRHGPALRHPALTAGAGSDRGLRPGTVRAEQLRLPGLRLDHDPALSEDFAVAIACGRKDTSKARGRNLDANSQPCHGFRNRSRRRPRGHRGSRASRAVGHQRRRRHGAAKPNFTFGPIKKNKKKGTAKLYVNVPAAGDLALEGTGRSKSDTTRANSQGSVFLNVKPNAKGKRKLRNKGKLQVNAVVTYTEDNEQPETEATSVLLKLKRKGY